MITWEQLYNLIGIADFINFISSPAIQDSLFFVKLAFIAFTGFFLCAIVWFYLNSSYLQYQFLQDTVEFFSWQAYGLRDISKRLKSIAKKIESGSEKECKLAIMEADDFLYQVLEAGGYEGESFKELLKHAGNKMVSNMDVILQAHAIRDSIAHNPDYKIEQEVAKKIFGHYEAAIKTMAVS